MRSVFSALVLFTAFSAQARNCNPEKSQPCGNACISKALTCHKNGGDAKAGVTKAQAVKTTPKVLPTKK